MLLLSAARKEHTGGGKHWEQTRNVNSCRAWQTKPAALDAAADPALLPAGSLRWMDFGIACYFTAQQWYHTGEQGRNEQQHTCNTAYSHLPTAACMCSSIKPVSTSLIRAAAVEQF